MKVLVTGGGGFLGQAICRQLVARGHTVRSMNRKRYPALDALGVEQRSGDIASHDLVIEAAQGVEAIVHSAGRVGAWGRLEDYYETNVRGTDNVLAACELNEIDRLVFTSSPSVVHAGGDLDGVDESAPYATHFSSAYAQTKALAEQRVLAANGPSLATVALRPHFIWGPGDPNLVPRILRRARRGQLRAPRATDVFCRRPATLDLGHTGARPHPARARCAAPSRPGRCARRGTDRSHTVLWRRSDVSGDRSHSRNRREYRENALAAGTSGASQGPAGAGGGRTVKAPIGPQRGSRASKSIVGSETWFREAFALPIESPNFTRRVMDQIALQFDRPNPTELLAQLNLTASSAGITQVSFRRGRGKTAHPEAGRSGRILRQAREELAEYLAGDRTFFSVPVDLSQVPEFERAALEIASQIPYGEVRSYKWIAEQLGKPDAARAVGGAMAGNPVPLIVPCHRVVGAGGTLRGYAWGIDLKRRLLAHELRIG